MANALYDEGRKRFLEGAIAWLTDTIKVDLIRSAGGGAGPYYTPNLTTDDFRNDIPSNSDARPTTAQTLTGKTSSAGVADANDVTFTTVASGDAIQLIIVLKDTGTESTSPLIAKIDTGTGLPVTPNGGDITVQWDNGANKVFKL
jgi:hypothetical protein